MKRFKQGHYLILISLFLFIFNLTPLAPWSKVQAQSNDVISDSESEASCLAKLTLPPRPISNAPSCTHSCETTENWSHDDFAVLPLGKSAVQSFLKVECFSQCGNHRISRGYCSREEMVLSDENENPTSKYIIDLADLFRLNSDHDGTGGTIYKLVKSRHWGVPEGEGHSDLTRSEFTCTEVKPKKHDVNSNIRMIQRLVFSRRDYPDAGINAGDQIEATQNGRTGSHRWGDFNGFYCEYTWKRSIETGRVTTTGLSCFYYLRCLTSEDNNPDPQPSPTP